MLIINIDNHLLSWNHNSIFMVVKYIETKNNYSTNLTESQSEAILVIIGDKRKHNHTLKRGFRCNIIFIEDRLPMAYAATRQIDALFNSLILIIDYVANL